MTSGGYLFSKRTLPSEQCSPSVQGQQCLLPVSTPTQLEALLWSPQTGHSSLTSVWWEKVGSYCKVQSKELGSRYLIPGLPEESGVKFLYTEIGVGRCTINLCSNSWHVSDWPVTLCPLGNWGASCSWSWGPVKVTVTYCPDPEFPYPDCS